MNRIFPYFGSKAPIAKGLAEIINSIDCHNLVLSFGGSASELIYLEKRRCEFYNDKFSQLSNFFQVLVQQRQEFLRRLKFMPYSEKWEWKELDEINFALDFYRKQIQFRNGYFRRVGNLDKVGGNLPVKQWNDLRTLIWYSQRMKNFTILNRTIGSLIKLLDRDNTLFYFDPPYWIESRKSKLKYKHDIIKESWHIALSNRIKNLKGKFVLVHYPCKLYDKLYKGFEYIDLVGKDDSGKKRIERVWYRK